MMSHVQIKICGITNVGDARACAELGADMIGLNFYRESPRYIETEAARKIVSKISGKVCPVGVFVEPAIEEVRRIAKTVRLSSVQLHGDVSFEMCRELAREFRVIRAVSTDRQFRPEDAIQFANCDVLVDAHHPQLRGGTGTMCDWSAARATLPFVRFLILSGGLNAENVGAAIGTVRPHAVDVCSGVEAVPGAKDHRATEQFIDAVRAAETSLLSPSA